MPCLRGVAAQSHYVRLESELLERAILQITNASPVGSLLAFQNQEVPTVLILNLRDQCVILQRALS